MIHVFADGLIVPRVNIVTFAEFPGSADENPASWSSFSGSGPGYRQEHMKYIDAWKDMGFLQT